MLSLFLLLLGSVGAQAHFFGCANERNLTLAELPFAYPFDTLVPQPYGNLSGGCAVWEFEIPSGKYATVIVSAEFDPSAYFIIRNSIGFKKWFLRDDSPSPIPQNIYGATYFFPADPVNTIYLNSNNSGFLSFRIDLHDVPSMPPAVEYKVDSQLNLVIPLYQIATNEYRFKHQKNGSDLVLSLVVNNPDDIRSDACFVYGGSSCKDGTFIEGFGWLGGDFSSHSRDVAVCCFSANIPDFYLIAVARPDFLKENDLWISRLIGEQTVDLDYYSSRPFDHYPDNSTTQYLTTYCPPQTINSVEYLQGISRIYSDNSASFANQTTFSIFTGYPGSSFSHISDIPLEDTYTWLPQEVRGTFKTYRSWKGDVTINLALNSKTWNYTTSDRKGFFMTNQYGVLSLDQSTFSKIYTTPNSEFTIDSYAYANHIRNGTVWLNTETDVVYLPPPSILNSSLHGSYLQFNADQQANATTGALLFFEIKHYPVSGSSFGATVIAVFTSVLSYVLH